MSSTAVIGRADIGRAAGRSAIAARSRAGVLRAAGVSGSSGVPAGARVRLRLTRRGRAALTFLAALPIVVGAFVFALNGGGAVASGEHAAVAFQHVTVQSGESLWSIAERLAPSADPRDVIAELVTLNGLDSAVVTPGQELAIPAQYAK